MASPQHVEIEAAKFLQKLIQESKDEPAKLATKLFVICQHMKMSGKEQSLPYQVISRAMETVINQHGLDMDALTSSRLPFSASGPTMVPGDVRINDRDAPESSTHPGSTTDSSIKTGNVSFGGQSRDISHGLPPNTSVMQDNQTIFAGQRAPDNTSFMGMEETRSGSSQEKQDPFGTEKSDLTKGSKDGKKVNTKRKRVDPALSMKEGSRHQIPQQNDAVNNIDLTSKKGKLMTHGQVENRRMEQVRMTPIQHADHQLSSFSGMRQPEEHEASSVSGFPASTRGSSRGMWNQTMVGFPSGISQSSQMALDNASTRMVEERPGFFQQPSGVIVNKGTSFRGPKGKDSILGDAGALDMDQNTWKVKADTSASDTFNESNMHIDAGRFRVAAPKETSKSPFMAHATSVVDLPFKEQHLRQLRAQCLVFLAFRNGLVPRKLHLEIALGERSTTDDGSFKLLNQQAKELHGLGTSQIHEGKESSGMDSSHSHEAGGAPSNNIRETGKDANTIRNIPGSSPSGSLSEMDAASKEIESARRANSKKGPPDYMVTSDERKRPPSAAKKYDSEADCQETAESNVKTSVAFTVDWVRPTEKTSSHNLSERRLYQDGNQQLEKNDHIQQSVLVRSKHGDHPLTGSAGSVISNEAQRSTMPSTSTQYFHPDISHACLTQSEGQIPTSASGKWESSPMILKPPATVKFIDHESNRQTGECTRHTGVFCVSELTGNTPIPGTILNNIKLVNGSDDSECCNNKGQRPGFAVSSSNQTPKRGQPVVPSETFTDQEETQDGEEEEEEEVEDIDMEMDGRPFSPPKYTMLEKWIMDTQKKKVLDEQKWSLKQRKAEERMEARIVELKEVVSSSNTTSSKTRSVIELKKLQLLHLQRRMKSEFLHDHFKPIATDMDRLKTIKKHRHGRRVKQLERYEIKMREERQKRLRERQKEFFSDLEAHKERLDDFYKIRRERWKGFNRFAKEFHKRKERIHKEKIDRIQREKINLLKNNDVEGYLRMVQDAKSERVKQLLKETEKYLQKLGAKLQEAKSVARQFELEMDDSGAVSASDRSDIPLPSEDERDQAKHYLENNEKYYQNAHSVKESINQQPSILQGGKLREYQMNGLRWLVSLYNNHLNGILADEMGLGKTVQVISLLCYLMESKNDRGPFLVVVPSSVLPGWVSEIAFWAPSITTIVYAGPPEERRRLFKERIVHQKFNVLLTTYEYLMNKHDRPKLSKILWHYIIIDEGHRIKNAACKLNAELKHYQSSHRLLLTGTPLQNNLEELWALLNFLLPNIFNSAEDFSQWFNKPFENGNDNSPDEGLLSEEENLLIINRLHQVLRPFMLRRLKHKVENELPEKIERLIRCEASAYQQLLMKRVEENLGSLGAAKGRSIHNTVMELRNICNHPYLSQLHAEEIDSFLPKHFLPTLVRLCGKLEMLDRLLPKLKATGHRVLCFSTMTRLLDVMEEYLSWKGYKYLRLDGHTSGSDRGMLIDEFNKPDSAAFIFLLSIRAGGVGVNLQAADTVVIFDTDWNPQVDLQAQARAHRIGQKRDVLVLRLETVRTVEEQVRASAEHKLGVANQSITAGFFDNNTSAEDRREYLEGLLRECKKEEAAPVLDDDALNYVLARSESEIDIFESIDKKRHEDELALWRKFLQAQGKDVTEQMPSRLVTEDDLKSFYQAMKIHESSNAAGKQKSEYLSVCDTQQYGRGKRAREVRSYEDQWTDVEFEKLCQADSPESPVFKQPAPDSLKTTDLVSDSNLLKQPTHDSVKTDDLGCSSKPSKEPAIDSFKTKDLVGPPKVLSVEEQPPSKRGRGRPKRGSDASLVGTETGLQQQLPRAPATAPQHHLGATTSAGPLPQVPAKNLAKRTPGSETKHRSLKHSSISTVPRASGETNQGLGPVKEAGVVLDKSPRVFVSQEKQWLNKPSKTVIPSTHPDIQGLEPKKPADLVSARVPGITHIEDKNISILPGPINRMPMKEIISDRKRPAGDQHEVSSISHPSDHMNKHAAKAGEAKSRKESIGQLSGTVASAESSVSGKSYLQSDWFGVARNTKPGSSEKVTLPNQISAPGCTVGASSYPVSSPGSCKIKFVNEGSVNVVPVEDAKRQNSTNLEKVLSSPSPDSKKKMLLTEGCDQKHSASNSSLSEKTKGDTSAPKAKISAECTDRQAHDVHPKRKASGETKMRNPSARKHSKSVTKYPVSQPVPSTAETLQGQPKIGCEQSPSSEQIPASMGKSSSEPTPPGTVVLQNRLNEDSKSVPLTASKSAIDNKVCGGRTDGRVEIPGIRPKMGSGYASPLGVTSSTKIFTTIEPTIIRNAMQVGELVGAVKSATADVGSAAMWVPKVQSEEGSASGPSTDITSLGTKKRVPKVRNTNGSRRTRSRVNVDSSPSVKVESAAALQDSVVTGNQRGARRKQLKEGSGVTSPVEKPTMAKVGDTAAVHDKTSTLANQPNSEPVTSVEGKQTLTEKVPAAIVHDQTEAPKCQLTKGSEYTPHAKVTSARSRVEGSHSSRAVAPFESSHNVDSEILNVNNEAIEEVPAGKSDRLEGCMVPSLSEDGTHAVSGVPTVLVHSFDANHDENVRLKSIQVGESADVCESKLTSQIISQGAHTEKNEIKFVGDANNVEDADLTKNVTDSLVRDSDNGVETEVGGSLLDRPNLLPCKDHPAQISGGDDACTINADTEERLSPMDLSHDDVPPGFHVIVSRNDNSVLTRSGGVTLPCMYGDHQQLGCNLVPGVGLTSEPESGIVEGRSVGRVLNQNNDVVVYSCTSVVKESLDSTDVSKDESSRCVVSEVLAVACEAVEDEPDKRSDKVDEGLHPPVSHGDAHSMAGVPTRLVHTVDTNSDENLGPEVLQVGGDMHETETQIMLPSPLYSLKVELSSLSTNGSPAHGDASDKLTALAIDESAITTGNRDTVEEQETLGTNTVNDEDSPVCGTIGEKSVAVQSADQGASSIADKMAEDGNATEGQEKLPVIVDNGCVDIDINDEGSDTKPSPDNDTRASHTTEENDGYCYQGESEAKPDAAIVNVDNAFIDSDATIDLGTNTKTSDAEACLDVRASSTTKETGYYHLTEGEEKLYGAIADKEHGDSTNIVTTSKTGSAEQCPDLKVSATVEETAGDSYTTEGLENLGAATAKCGDWKAPSIVEETAEDCHVTEREEKLAVAKKNVDICTDTVMTDNFGHESDMIETKSNVTPSPDMKASVAERMSGICNNTGVQEILPKAFVMQDNVVALSVDASVVVQLDGEHHKDTSVVLPEYCHATEGEENLNAATMNVDKCTDANMTDVVDGESHMDDTKCDITLCPDMEPSAAAEGMSGIFCNVEEQEIFPKDAVPPDNVHQLEGEFHKDDSVSSNEDCHVTEGEEELHASMINVDKCTDTIPTISLADESHISDMKSDITPSPDLESSSAAEGMSGICNQTEEQEKLPNVPPDSFLALPVDASVVDQLDFEHHVDTSTLPCLDNLQPVSKKCLVADSVCVSTETASNVGDDNDGRDTKVEIRDVVRCAHLVASSVASEEIVGDGDARTERQEKLPGATVTVFNMDISIDADTDGVSTADPFPDMGASSSPKRSFGDIHTTEGEEQISAASAKEDIKCVDTTTVHIDGRSDVGTCPDVNGSCSRSSEPSRDCHAAEGEEKLVAAVTANAEEEKHVDTTNAEEKEHIDTTMTVDLHRDYDISGMKSEVTPSPPDPETSSDTGVAENNETGEQENVSETTVALECLSHADASVVADLDGAGENNCSTQLCPSDARAAECPVADKVTDNFTATGSNEVGRVARETDSIQIEHLSENRNGSAVGERELNPPPPQDAP